jgi:hypothetical protein
MADSLMVRPSDAAIARCELHRLLDAVFIINRAMDAERNALHRVNSALGVFCACTEDMQEGRCAKICRDGFCGIVTKVRRERFTCAKVTVMRMRGSKAAAKIGEPCRSGLRLLRQPRLLTGKSGSAAGTGTALKRLPPWRKILIYP